MSFSVDPYTVCASMDGEYTVPAGIWSPWPGAICRIANNEPDAKSNPEASNATGNRKLEEAIESSERLHKWPLVDIATERERTGKAENYSCDQSFQVV